MDLPIKDLLGSFKNLPDSVRAQLIVELLLPDTNCQNNPDSTLNNIQRFLVNKSPEKNSSPKKKQKTLDEWLIKHNDTSKNLGDQPSSHQSTKSDFDKVSESEKNQEENSSGNLASKNSGNSNEDSVTPSTSSLVEKSPSNDLSPCVSKKDETSNLFHKKCALRSKRKVSQSPPSSESGRTPKRVKNTSEKQDHLRTNDSEEIESHKLIDPNCSSENLNIDKRDNTGNDNLISKKKTYNLRTKTKNTKLVQVDKASNNTSTTEENQTDTNVSNTDHRSNITVLEPNYEAFNKLNLICKEMNLNVSEILRDKNVQSVLSDPKILNNDAIVFLGSLQLNTGKTLPVVHLAKSKKELLKHLV